MIIDARIIIIISGRGTRRDRAELVIDNETAIVINIQCRYARGSKARGTRDDSYQTLTVPTL